MRGGVIRGLDASLLLKVGAMARVKNPHPGRVSPKGQPFQVRVNNWRWRVDRGEWTPYTRAMNARYWKTASRVKLALQLDAFGTDMVKCQLNFDRL